jgi:hypothetical protein
MSLETEKRAITKPDRSNRDSTKGFAGQPEDFATFSCQPSVSLVIGLATKLMATISQLLRSAPAMPHPSPPDPIPGRVLIAITAG